MPWAPEKPEPTNSTRDNTMRGKREQELAGSIKIIRINDKATPSCGPFINRILSLCSKIQCVKNSDEGSGSNQNLSVYVSSQFYSDLQYPSGSVISYSLPPILNACLQEPVYVTTATVCTSTRAVAFRGVLASVTSTTSPFSSTITGVPSSLNR